LAETETTPVGDITGKLTGSVIAYLLDRGFNVEAPAKLRGESGTEHTASISANGPEHPKLLLDTYAPGRKIGEEQVINTYTKVLDTSPTQAFIICVPGATDSAQRLAQLYRIGLIEGSSIEEIAKKLPASALASAGIRQLAHPPRVLHLGKPGVLRCDRCGYVWKTRSKSGYATCPSCYFRIKRPRTAAARPLLQRG